MASNQKPSLFKALRQWLKRALLERLGITANLNLTLPAHFLWDLYLKPQITSQNRLTGTRSR